MGGVYPQEEPQYPLEEGYKSQGQYGWVVQPVGNRYILKFHFIQSSSLYLRVRATSPFFPPKLKKKISYVPVRNSTSELRNMYFICTEAKQMTCGKNTRGHL